MDDGNKLGWLVLIWYALLSWPSKQSNLTIIGLEEGLSPWCLRCKKSWFKQTEIEMMVILITTDEQSQG